MTSLTNDQYLIAVSIYLEFKQLGWDVRCGSSGVTLSPLDDRFKVINKISKFYFTDIMTAIGWAHGWEEYRKYAEIDRQLTEQQA
jgi:hypothetical protein